MQNNGKFNEHQHHQNIITIPQGFTLRLKALRKFSSLAQGRILSQNLEKICSFPQGFTIINQDLQILIYYCFHLFRKRLIDIKNNYQLYIIIANYD